MAIDEETLREYLDDPQVRHAWNIPKANRYAKVFAVVHIVALVAMVAALIAYFALADRALVANRPSGLVIVAVLAFAVSIMRFPQLRAEIRDLAAFKRELARNLNGQDAHDVDAQQRVEEGYLWPSRHYSVVAKMAGVTAFIVLIINTYQIAGLDLFRTVVFDLAIVAYLAGSLWNNFAFKAELLEAELEVRMRASLEYRERDPEGFQRQYDEPDGYSDDDIDYSAAPRDPRDGQGGN